jgi:hypothetical protein
MSSDKQPTITSPMGKPLSGLSVGEFLEVLDFFFHHNSRERKYLTGLQLHEFAAMMVDLQSTKQYVQAAKEHETSLRVFGDVETLVAASLPFRVKTKDEAATLYADLLKTLTDNQGAEVIVAVGVAKP